MGQIFNKRQLPKIVVNKSQKILCAKFRKGHFEGVKLISPKSIFMGEKDYQQFFLVKKFIEKNYKTKVYACKTIRDKNMIALSSRNNLLNKENFYNLGLITNKLVNLKKNICKKKKNSKELIQEIRKDLIKKFEIRVEYMECRNMLNLKTNIHNKSFKLFVAYYLNNVRLIDNF